MPGRYTSRFPSRIYSAKIVDGEGRYGRFVQEILEQVDADVDFGQFDNDGPDGIPDSGDDDGRVDYLSIQVRSAPPGFIKGAATGIAGLGFEQDFITSDVSPEGAPIRVAAGWAYGHVIGLGSPGAAAFARTVNTMAHELGHSFGLPDLYDKDWADGPVHDSAGIGSWGLMGRFNADGGPVPMCAWSREQLGWLGVGNEGLVDVTRDSLGLVVGDLRRQGAAYRIPLLDQSTRGTLYSEEYLLLEFRSHAGDPYSRSLPEGLLIWHVNN